MADRSVPAKNFEDIFSALPSDILRKIESYPAMNCNGNYILANKEVYEKVKQVYESWRRDEDAACAAFRDHFGVDRAPFKYIEHRGMSPHTKVGALIQNPSATYYSAPSDRRWISADEFIAKYINYDAIEDALDWPVLRVAYPKTYDPQFWKARVESIIKRKNFAVATWIVDRYSEDDRKWVFRRLLYAAVNEKDKENSMRMMKATYSIEASVLEFILNTDVADCKRLTRTDCAQHPSMTTENVINVVAAASNFGTKRVMLAAYHLQLALGRD